MNNYLLSSKNYPFNRIRVRYCDCCAMSVSHQVFQSGVVYCVLLTRYLVYFILGITLLGIRAYTLDVMSRATAVQKSSYLYMWFVESGIALSTVLWGAL